MVEGSIQVCVIEDDPLQRELLTRQLLDAHYTVASAADGPEGLQQIYRHRPRIVLCDISLPLLDGIEIVQRLRSDPTFDATYVLLMTAYNTRSSRYRALAAGADDYLVKPYDARELMIRVSNGMRIHRLQERLTRAALTDGLTDLWNYSQFRELLEREFSRQRRYGGAVSLLMLDLDHFKAVNDTYGHEVGNEVLKLTARHIVRMVRETDMVARYGGEEFAIICPNTDLEEAAALAERIRGSLAQQVHLSEHPHLQVTTSIGVVSTSDPRVSTAADLVNVGDKALYVAKHFGRDRVVRSTDIDRQHAAGDATASEEMDRLRKETVSLRMQFKDLCLRSIWSLVEALDARDAYTVWHSRNVTLYAAWIAELLDCPPLLRHAIANAAMLHDLGKIGVPDHVLQKSGQLTKNEAAMVRQTPLLTCRILEPLQVFQTELAIIRHLRERFDGAGFPDGLVGDAIPLGSRVLAIAEAFDSLTCDRAFRAAREIDAALEVIREDAGKQFDPQIVEAMLNDVHDAPDRWTAQIRRACSRRPSQDTGWIAELGLLTAEPPPTEPPA